MKVDIEAIKSTIATTLEVPVQRLGANSSSQTVEAWDSIAHINVVMALEQRFDVKFTMDEIVQLQNVSTICEVIEAKVHGDGNSHKDPGLHP
jgi:acyl carrier protein